MAVKFSQFDVAAQISDIEYLVGYKGIENVQLDVGLLDKSLTTTQSGSDADINLVPGSGTTDVVKLEAGDNITLTVAGNVINIEGADAPVTSVNGETGTVVLDTDDISQGTTNLYNVTHTGDVTGATVLTIADNAVTQSKIASNAVGASEIQSGAVDTDELADDSVTYAKLGTEFTTSAALATNVDFSTAQVFTKTLSGATTLTFSNTAIGMVKDLVITGDFALTLPAGSTVAGTYNGTVSNLIQIVVTGASQYWYSISQPQ